MTIEESWNQFESITLPPPVPEFQRDMLKKAFYAGCMVMFQEINNLAQEMGEDAACAKLSEIHLELTQFADDVILKDQMRGNGTVN